MTELTDMLATIDQDEANGPFLAFERAAQGLSVATVMWALAMTQARVLASMDADHRLDAAATIGAMCQVALPGALMRAQQMNGAAVVPGEDTC